MADKEKKVDEAQEPVTEQVELVGEAVRSRRCSSDSSKNCFMRRT